MPVALLEKVVNDIEFGGEEDDDVMERKLMTTIIKLHESRLSGKFTKILSKSF